MSISFADDDASQAEGQEHDPASGGTSDLGLAESVGSQQAEIRSDSDVGVDPAAEMVVKYSPSGKHLSVGVEVSLVSTHLAAASPEHLQEPSGPSAVAADGGGRGGAGGGANERKLSREEAKALRRAKAEVPPSLTDSLTHSLAQSLLLPFPSLLPSLPLAPSFSPSRDAFFVCPSCSPSLP